MIPARSGLIHEGQGQARLHLKFNARGPTNGVQFFDANSPFKRSLSALTDEVDAPPCVGFGGESTPCAVFRPRLKRPKPEGGPASGMENDVVTDGRREIIGEGEARRGPRVCGRADLSKAIAVDQVRLRDGPACRRRPMLALNRPPTRRAAGSRRSCAQRGRSSP